MYKTVFQNSKAALAFAAMTLFGAVSIVGTSEDGGVIGTAVDIVSAERTEFAGAAEAFAEEHSVGDRPSNAGSGWGSEDEVFGEFSAEPTVVAPRSDSPPRSGGFNPADAPMAPDAIIVTRRSESATAVPYISDREMTITAE